MIPGHVNHISFVPLKAGTYLGECAEFCGVEHGQDALPLRGRAARGVLGLGQAPAEAGGRADRSRRDRRRAGHQHRRLRQLPRRPRHDAQRHVRPRTSPTSAAAGGIAAYTLPNTPENLLKLDPGPAGGQAAVQDAAGPAAAAAAAAARRLPRGAEVSDVVRPARRRCAGRPGATGRARRGSGGAARRHRRLAHHDRPQEDRPRCTSARRCVFFLIAVVFALLMRTQLIRPDMGFLSPEAYNQIFSMHGTTMIFLFGDADAHRAGELPRAAADRRARHGVPARQRAELLAAAVRGPAAVQQLPLRRRARHGLVQLRAAHTQGVLAARRRHLLDRRAGAARRLLDPRLDQLHRHRACASAPRAWGCGRCRSSRSPRSSTRSSSCSPSRV